MGAAFWTLGIRTRTHIQHTSKRTHAPIRQDRQWDEHVRMNATTTTTKTIVEKKKWCAGTSGAHAYYACRTASKYRFRVFMSYGNRFSFRFHFFFFSLFRFHKNFFSSFFVRSFFLRLASHFTSQSMRTFFFSSFYRIGLCTWNT